MERFLLHTCCGPCLACAMASSDWPSGEVTAYFYNPNVHPASEFRLRLDAFDAMVRRSGLPARVDASCPIQEFTCGALDAEAAGEPRCLFCYRTRLGAAAREAEQGGFDAFSTTLLASPHQKRNLILEAGAQAADAAGVGFAPLDLRDGWMEGRKAARRQGLYLQRYCGCAFSEAERQAARRQEDAVQPGKR